MHVLVAVGEFAAEFIHIAINLLGPPSDTLLMAAKTSSGGSSTVKVVVK